MHGETSLEPRPSHPTASPLPRAPHPATKLSGTSSPAWQAAWPGPFSKEAHFLPPWPGWMSQELPTAAGQTPASICNPGRCRPPEPSSPSHSPLGQRPPARPRALRPLLLTNLAATLEGWSRDAVAPAACSLRVSA